MAMFKKSGRSNVRRQRRSSSDDDDAVSSSAAAGGRLAQAPSSGSLLSFAGDDDDDATPFQLKKGREQNRRLEKLQRRARDDARRRRPSSSPADDDRSSQPRPPSPDSTVRPETPDKVRVAEADSSTETANGDAPAGFSSRSTALKFNMAGDIPDADAVYRARKQRQKAREGEVIPLVDDTQRYRNDKSRLVREEDEDASDDGEEGGRFFSARQLRQQAEDERRRDEAAFLSMEQGGASRGPLFAVAVHCAAPSSASDDEEVDEELERWEMEQIRKGVSKQQLSAIQEERAAASMYHPELSKGLLRVTMSSDGRLVSALPPPTEVRDPEPMEIEHDEMDASTPKLGGGVAAESAPSVAEVVARMKSRLGETDKERDERVLSLEKTCSHLSENEASITRLSAEGPQLQQQHLLFQQMIVYVRDLLDCFNEKVPLIRLLEQRRMTLLRSRRDFCVQRRRQDVRDQFEECAAAASGNQAALQQDADRLNRVADREARRGRRRRARENSVAALSHRDGSSSDDDEAPSRLAAFDAELGSTRPPPFAECTSRPLSASIGDEAAVVFDDALDEFASVKHVCAHFADWLAVDAASFDEAYIALCQARVLAPLVRLQMILWNPLVSEHTPISSFPWFADVLGFGAGADAHVPPEHEAVVNAVPLMIEKAVVPPLTDVAENGWNVTSSTECRNFAALLKRFLATYPTMTDSSKTVSRLLETLLRRIRESLDEDLFTPIYSRSVLDNSASGARLFLDRQFWLSIKMLRNVACFDGLFSATVMHELLMDGIVNRHVVLVLQSCSLADVASVAKCRAVVDALPASIDSCSTAHLEPLAKILKRMVSEFSAVNASRETVKELNKMLAKLHVPR